MSDNKILFENDKRFGLMVLRGLLTIFIAQFHFMKIFHFHPNDFFQKFLSQYAIDFLYLFFIMSSYLLYERYSVYKEKTKKPAMVFYIKRFFRIYPLWFVMAITYYFSNQYLWQTKIELKYLFANLTFLFGFFSGNLMNYTVIGWSLFVEEIFYLFAPLLFRHKKLWVHLLLFVFCFLFFRNIDFYPQLSKEIVTMQSRAINKTLYLFILGIILCEIFRFKNNKKLSKPFFLFTLMSILLYSGDFKTITIATTIILADIFIKNKNMVSNFLFFVGERCFAVYLIHILVFDYIYLLCKLFDYKMNNFYFFSFLGIGITIFISDFVFRYFELNMHKFGKSLISKWGFLNSEPSVR